MRSLWVIFIPLVLLVCDVASQTLPTSVATTHTEPFIGIGDTGTTGDDGDGIGSQTLSVPLATKQTGRFIAIDDTSTDDDGGVSQTLAPPAETGQILRFIAIGDTGTGNDGDASHLQYEVAAMLRQVCEMRGCDFAVLAGDNMYEKGVEGTDDPLFDEAFEQPYGDIGIPFYVALGNHDNSKTDIGEGSQNTKGDIQVAYTEVSPSGAWQMPERFYTQTFTTPVGESPFAQLFTVDSSPMSHFFDDTGAPWRGDALDSYILKQTRFMQDQLAASRAPWKIALAHHPYVSNGQHGNAGMYDLGTNPDPCFGIEGARLSKSCRGEAYQAFLEATICDEVDLFIAGHDHELYWFKPQPGCGKTQQIVSGAGAKSRDVFDATRNDAYFQLGMSWGFFWIELHEDRLVGAAYALYPDGTYYHADDQGRPLPVFEQVLMKLP
jgi:tartrate-resistant acid phosphatase type 5